jgi:proline iminopeptidase
VTGARPPWEGDVPVAGAVLHGRTVGQGPPIVVLHGGPDFDYRYLLPEMDRLADAFTLVYYDQRGRGRSARGVEPADVSLASEIADLDAVRRHFELDSIALVGHSWGSALAMEYAIRHPGRVTHLVLLNPAPASHEDVQFLRHERRRRWPGDLDQLQALAATDAYREGDPEMVARYYRIHFRATVRAPEQLEEVIRRLQSGSTPEAILKSRRIVDRLMDETWRSAGYDLLPALRRLDLPALVVHGEQEFIPRQCAARIAEAIPGARLVELEGTGHFSYLERPDAVRREISEFLATR